jgi:hypothetical protein
MKCPAFYKKYNFFDVLVFLKILNFIDKKLIEIQLNYQKFMIN